MRIPLRPESPRYASSLKYVQSNTLTVRRPYLNSRDPYYARLHVLNSEGFPTRIYCVPKLVLAEGSNFFRMLFETSSEVRHTVRSFLCMSKSLTMIMKTGVMLRHYSNFERPSKSLPRDASFS